MRESVDQLGGLSRLAERLGKYEVNSVIKQDPGDVACLQMLDTPGGSQAVYADPKVDAYDIWNSEGHLQKPNLTIGETVEVLVAEYFLAKAARVKQHRPDLSVDEIMVTLRAGYQKSRHA